MLCKLYFSYNSAKYVPHLFSNFLILCKSKNSCLYDPHLFSDFLKLDKRDFHKILLNICDFFKESAQASA